MATPSHFVQQNRIGRFAIDGHYGYDSSINDKTLTKNPTAELANKDWVMKELMDTEFRFEKAFHEQTQFLGQKIENKLDNTLRWMIGLMITMTVCIILAVLFKG